MGSTGSKSKESNCMKLLLYGNMVGAREVLMSAMQPSQYSAWG